MVPSFACCLWYVYLTELCHTTIWPRTLCGTNSNMLASGGEATEGPSGGKTHPRMNRSSMYSSRSGTSDLMVAAVDLVRSAYPAGTHVP
jgi:hypothetical protein